MYSLNPSNPSFFDSQKLLKEFVRQATVCHGCRLCFNYCDAFPTLFSITDKKGPARLSLDDLFEVASKCFHCKMCFVNCPYVPPHEFNMDFPSLMEWAWLYYKTKVGLSFRDYLFEGLDGVGLVRPIAKRLLEKGKAFMGISEDAPTLRLAEKGFRERVKSKKLQSPKARVALFPTCLVENFFPEIGEDLVEVYNRLGIEVEVPSFSCCGAPMLDSGDAKRLKRNAERNAKIIEEYVRRGYDVVSPIPTCTLTLNEYRKVLDRETPKVYDALEYLVKLNNEGKVEIKGKLATSVFYHPPCHMKYLRAGLPGVRALRLLGAKVEISDKGCSGIDGGWGLRNYSVAKRVGSKMMEAFRNSRAETFATECPLAGLQIEKASGRKPMHPISLLRKALESGEE